MEEDEALRVVADQSVSTAERIEAAAALGRPGTSDKAFDALVLLVIKDSTPLELRIAATRSIGELGRRHRGYDSLVGRFDYPLSLRRETVVALRKLGHVHQQQEDTLLTQLDTVARDPTDLALVNLGHWGWDPRIVEACIKAARDPRPQVRRSALASLVMIGEFLPVIEALNDADDGVRASAARMLGSHGDGDEEQVEALRRSMGDSSSEVRENSKRSLRQLGVIERAKPPERGRVSIALVDGRFDWPSLLENFSHALVRDRYLQLDLPDEVVESGWLGFPGADPDAIAAAETRLNLKLPPSYRSFLRTTNGFRRAGVSDLWPVERIDFAKIVMPTAEWWSDEPEVVDKQYFVYGADQDPVHMRLRYLPGCLAISAYLDGEMYVLNPVVRFGDEWEAWLLSSRLPGANRYQSFWDLMESEYKTQVQPPEVP